MRILIIILAALLFTAPSSAQSSKPSSEPARTASDQQAAKPAPLRNADVIDLVSAKISADLVVAQIHRATAISFDLSTAGLVSLKKANVPDAIVKAMMDRQDAKGPLVDPVLEPSTSSRQSAQSGTDNADSKSRWGRLKGRFKGGNNQMYVPLDDTVREPKEVAQVILLEKEPTGRKFKVIGIIAPPSDDYDSVAEALNAIRRAAAKNGADAVFIVSESTEVQTGIDVGLFGGGTTSEQLINMRAKAIVWQ